VKNNISKYFSNKIGLILFKIKYVFVHSVKFVHKKCCLRKKLPLESQKKRRGRCKIMCGVKQLFNSTG